MAEKKAPKKERAGGNGVIQDIAHEEVRNAEPGTVAVTPKLITVDEQIRLELAKFNLADAAIAKMKETYGQLVISGADDKDGYKAVKEAWNDTRSKRTGLEKKGLELRGGYGVITKAIKKEEDRLVELLEPLESDLYAKWKAIDDEKERAKREREEAEQRELMVRVEEVLQLGMTFSDGMYVIGDTISIDVASLRAMPADQYEKFKGAVQAKAAELKKIADDLVEQKRKEAEEFQRQQNELKRQQDELAEQQRKMKAQQEQLERDRQEAAKLKQELRVGKFLALGMNQSGNWLVYDNGFKSVRLDVADIMAWTDESIPEMVRDWKAEMGRIDTEKHNHEAQQKAEQQALDAHKKMIAAEMEKVGLVYSYTGQSFNWEDKNKAISVKFSDLLHLDEAAIKKMTEDLTKEIADAKAATIAHDTKVRQAQEQEQKLAMGDKERYTQGMNAIEAAVKKLVPAEFKTKKYQGTVQSFLDQVSELLQKFS